MEQETIQAVELIINGIPNLDAWLIPFITKNVITLGIVVKALKILAKKTPWAADDEIVQLFTGLLPNKGNK